MNQLSMKEEEMAISPRPQEKKRSRASAPSDVTGRH